jgi:hypothetical protein
MQGIAEGQVVRTTTLCRVMSAEHVDARLVTWPSTSYYLLLDRLDRAQLVALLAALGAFSA